MRLLVRIESPLIALPSHTVASLFLDKQVSMVRPRIEVVDGKHTAGLAYRDSSDDINGAIVVVCADADEATRAAAVIGRAIVSAYDKWEASTSPIEEPLTLRLSASEIMAEVRGAATYGEPPSLIGTRGR